MPSNMQFSYLDFFLCVLHSSWIVCVFIHTWFSGVLIVCSVLSVFLHLHPFIVIFEVDDYQLHQQDPTEPQIPLQTISPGSFRQKETTASSSPYAQSHTHSHSQSSSHTGCSLTWCSYLQTVMNQGEDSNDI